MNSIVTRIKGSYTSRFITPVLIVVITFTGGIMTTTESPTLSIGDPCGPLRLHHRLLQDTSIL
jgi:hypothetical protein